MENLEIHLPTRRQLPKELVEMFNWQTCKDFTLKILTRYPQQWRAEDLNVDFPVELKPTKLAYSTGTKYAMCLANNELLCSARSKYVLRIEDFMVMSPISVEKFLLQADEGLCMTGYVTFIHETWEDYGLSYDTFKGDMDEATRTAKPIFEYLGANEFNMRGGLLFFPLKVYRKLNGWDIGIDGLWGGADYNLGKRLTRAGFKFAIHSVSALHFEHIWHGDEHNDPPISNELYVYNKETGAKMDWKKRRGNYEGWCMKNNVVRAPQGLQEVCELLEM